MDETAVAECCQRLSSAILEQRQLPPARKLFSPLLQLLLLQVLAAALLSLSFSKGGGGGCRGRLLSLPHLPHLLTMHQAHVASL